MRSGPARILLADDHTLVRHGLRLVLESQRDLRVVAEAQDGVDALEAALAEDLDLAVLDVMMPRLTGLQVARQLAAQRPSIKTVILSMHDNEQFLAEAQDAGASGYVLKSAAHSDLVEACRGALHGARFVFPRGVAASDTAEDPLSAREAEVVKLVAEGMTSREIGGILHISEKTVERHRSNVLEKLGLRDRVALTRYAIRRGLVEP